MFVFTFKVISATLQQSDFLFEICKYLKAFSLFTVKECSWGANQMFMLGILYQYEHKQAGNCISPEDFWWFLGDCIGI